MSIARGTYLPNEPGARTIAEGRPLYIDGKRISIEVSDQVALFHGLEIIYQGPMPEGIQYAHELFQWAADYRPAAPGPARMAQIVEELGLPY
jgi:hypothetical protein